MKKSNKDISLSQWSTHFRGQIVDRRQGAQGKPINAIWGSQTLSLPTPGLKLGLVTGLTNKPPDRSKQHI